MKKAISALQIPKGADRILLHACCAPCSGAILEWMLEQNLQPTLFFCNPNIFPLQEYNQRKNELIQHAQRMHVPFADGDYDHQAWLEQIQGLEDEPERGQRCMQCFTIRLQRTAQYAHRNGFPVFTTTLASSRWKNLAQITEAGQQAAAFYPDVHFWAQNWRRGGLSERRSFLLKTYDFYNQTYCGCEFSLRARQAYERAKAHPDE
ncbi:MAG: diacylglucosamine hydrolase [Bacteroidetes bacterium]|nr:MAG: diacylglucosamine hydrolase [Bacteroidota bacterium]